jgi:transposase InsO family protein
VRLSHTIHPETLVIHPNSPLAPEGRFRLVQLVLSGFTQAEVARRMNISRATVWKWCKRYRDEGRAGLEDRPSRARRIPHALPAEIVDRVCNLRRELGCGPHRIAAKLKMAPSTVYGVLRRAGISNLRYMDRVTREVIRYERSRPGELVHLDVKKLGRIPDGGGKRFDEGFKESLIGRHRPGRRGFAHVHVAVDDHSRFAYAEVLADEKGPTTAAFLERAIEAFAVAGMPVEEILTDNAFNYRKSADFAEVVDLYGLKHRFTRPYRPQTNGKAEAFNKILQREWAYLRPYTSESERLAALRPFLDDYNYGRPHTAIGNRPPASRM